MATVCDHCGYRDSEAKGGTGIEPKGCLIDLHIKDIADLSRDVLKVCQLPYSKSTKSYNNILTRSHTTDNVDLVIFARF